MLTDQERADFMSLESGQVSDAMEYLRLRRSVVPGMTLAGPSDTKMVGPAVTIRQVSKSANDDPHTPAMRHREVSGGLAKKGDVIVVDVGGRTDVATWGEFHCYRASRNEVAGAVVYGAIRDAPLIRKSGFPVFCSGFSPVKSRWDLKTAALNEPVMVGGIECRPGDIVFADETGVIIIPIEKKEAVLQRALEIGRDEDKQRADFLGASA